MKLQRDIDLEGLRAFVEVASRLSFFEAAEVLAVSPSALTRRVKRLEAALETPLLERTTRRVSLTPLGRDFLPRAKSIIEGLDSSLRWLEGASQAQMGQLTIACVPTIARSMLPRLVAVYSQRWPDVRIRIVETHVASMLRMLHEHAVDLAVGFLPSPDPDLLLDELMVDPYDLACRKDHPLAQHTVVTWSDLKPHPLIVSGNGRSSGNRRVLDAALKSLDWQPEQLIQIEHLSTSLGLVEQGLGITVVPRSALTPELRQRLAIKTLTEPQVKRTIGVLRRRTGNLSAAARHFRLTLRRLAPLDADQQLA